MSEEKKTKKKTSKKTNKEKVPKEKEKIDEKGENSLEPKENKIQQPKLEEKQINIPYLKGVFMNYKQSRHVIHPKFAIIKVEGVNTRKQAYSLIGKRARWVTPSGKYMVGKITKVHGNKGCLIARFGKAGLPGQAIGSELLIY